MKRVLFILILSFISIFSFAQFDVTLVSATSYSVCLENNDTISVQLFASGGNTGTYIFELEKETSPDVFETVSWGSYPITLIDISSVTLEDTIFIIGPGQAEDGKYRYKIENDGEILYSDTFTIYVSTVVPKIFDFDCIQPILCPGVPAEINISLNSAENLIFDWFKNASPTGFGDTPMVGQPENIAYINNPSANYVGSYTLRVANACGSDSTNTPIVFTYGAPIINPVFDTPLFICEGEGFSVEIFCSGDDLSYEWYHKVSGISTLLSEQTTNILTLTNVQYPAEGTYFMVAENSCGTDTLIHDFGVQVIKIPEITGELFTDSVCPGINANLYAYPETYYPLTYYWFDNSSIIPIDSTYSNLIGFEIDANNIAPYYYYVAKNFCGSDTSNQVSIFLKESPNFGTSPLSQTICAGEELHLNCKVGGSEVITLTWFYLHDTMSAALPIDAMGLFSNATFSNNNWDLIIPQVTISQGGKYFVKAVNDCGVAFSDTAIIVINDTIVLLDLPINISQCEGTPLTINTIAFGTAPITYNWYKEASPNDINLGNTTSTFTITNLQPSDAGIYYCELSNICGIKQSTAVDVIVKLKPVVTSQLQQINICEGENIPLAITANGEPPLSYSWYYGNYTWSASGQTVNRPNALVSNSGYYYCSITGSCGSKLDSVFVSVGTQITINPNLTGVNSFCEFLNLQLSVEIINGQNYNIIWYKEENPVINESSNPTTLLINHAAASYAGNYYCSVINGCGSVNSNTVSISITSAPIVNLGQDLDICTGDSVKLQPTSICACSYFWSDIDTLHTPYHYVSTSGTYILSVTDGNSGCENSDTVVVAVHPIIHPQLNSSISQCATSIVLNPGQGAASYLWNNGATTATLTVTESGIYSVTVWADAYLGCNDSAKTVVTLKEPVSIDLGDDKYSTVDLGVTINAPTTYSSYIWKTDFQLFSNDTISDSPSLFVDGEIYGLGDHVFWIIVTGASGCSASDTINVIFIPANRIEENDINNSISIYPNPADNYINIISKCDDIQRIIIFSIEGKELMSKRINGKTETIDLNNLTIGTYFIKIQTDKNIYVKKFIKN